MPCGARLVAPAHRNNAGAGNCPEAPCGLRGCGFFQVRDGLIVFQRGYFDQLSFFRQQGLPVPHSYLG